MSLLSILTDTENQELRDKLKSEFPHPKCKFECDIKASPLTNNGGIVGTAFDYLLRFHLQRINIKKVESRTLVADTSFIHLYDYILEYPSNNIPTGFRKEKIFDKEKLLEILDSQNTKLHYVQFLINGIVTEDLVKYALFLAKLDLYIRNKTIDANFDNHDSNDVKDIFKLFNLIDDSLFKAQYKCYLNPTFGKGSKLVRGADADLIVDNVLIDIKTTKDLSITRIDLNQIIGYYILSLIGGVNQNPLEKPIEYIGIYFARYGLLWKTPVSSFGSTKKIEDFKDWFLAFIKSKSRASLY